MQGSGWGLDRDPVLARRRAVWTQSSGQRWMADVNRHALQQRVGMTVAWITGQSARPLAPQQTSV